MGPDIESPCQIGNGEFAVTVDITGLQTFPAMHDGAMPLGTMAQWGWHSVPRSESKAEGRTERGPGGAIYSLYDSHGRMVTYADGRGDTGGDVAVTGMTREAVWQRLNPHRLHLGRIGLLIKLAADGMATIGDIHSPRQELDLWTGTIESRFLIESVPVAVTTMCHPTLDLLAVRVRSPLVASGQIGIVIAFPYGSEEWERAADWGRPERHHTQATERAFGMLFDRSLDDTHYVASASWSDGARLRRSGDHAFELTAMGHETLDLTVAFSPSHVFDPPRFDQTARAASANWAGFWTEGGALDLSASTDPRAHELERRLVLSQYLTAVNCAGSIPPQETGLVTNSWYGKHHLEMHWWHAAHFPLWGRAPLLERSMAWYQRILPRARDIARRQGYAGARWPKMAGPEGYEAPSEIGVFLIWQQPHPIFFAELLYRAQPTRATLVRYADLVFVTAEFMASYAALDVAQSRFVLGPPLIPAQESYGTIRGRVINPTFELAYWRWGLDAAQRWLERLGRPRNARWARIVSGLSRPTVRDGMYAAIASEPFTLYADHPSMLAALGMLPETPLVDETIMRRTLVGVWTRWDWASTWGWDYPMMAMTAARIRDPARAIDALLMDTPKNRYLANGHNHQSTRLPLYLPGNGGLLYAAALMAAGWRGGPASHAPGFPDDGRWRVQVEGIRQAI